MAQDSATTGCLVDDPSWRRGDEFVAEAKRENEGAWYYEETEVTYSFHQIDSQKVPHEETHTYHYEFKTESGKSLKCSAEFQAKKEDKVQRIKFIKATCEGDVGYACDKNYSPHNDRFRVRYTIKN